jgi:hypothetical protein
MGLKHIQKKLFKMKSNLHELKQMVLIAYWTQNGPKTNHKQSNSLNTPQFGLKKEFITLFPKVYYVINGGACIKMATNLVKNPKTSLNP